MIKLSSNIYELPFQTNSREKAFAISPTQHLLDAFYSLWTFTWWTLITESEKFDILFVKHKNLLNEYAAFFPPILFYCYPVVGQSEVKQNFLLRPRNGNSDYYGAQSYGCFNTYFAEQGIS